MGYRADGSGQSGPRGGVNRSRQSRFSVGFEATSRFYPGDDPQWGEPNVQARAGLISPLVEACRCRYRCTRLVWI